MKQVGERESSLVVGVFLRFLDVVFIIAAARYSYHLYFDTWSVPEHYRLAYSMGALLVLTFFPGLKVYRFDRGSSRIDEAGRVVFALGVLFLMLTLTAVLSKTSQSYSRIWFVLWFVLSALSFGAYRFVFRMVLRGLRRRGVNQKNIVLVGTARQSQHVFEVISRQSWLGFTIEGFYQVDDSTTDNSVTEKGRLPVKGTKDDLLERVQTAGIDEVWLCLPVNRASELEALLNDLSRVALTVRYVPDFFGFDLINHSVSQVGELPVVNLSVTPMEGWNRVIKWFEDKLLSAIILLLISPVLLAVGIGVKLSSPGPVFYRQERVSWNGRSFNMLKFRSMPENNEQNGVHWGGAKSKEVTPFGRFIRATSLDELPQFVNVLKGDMSIVGPRPERTLFVDQFKQEIPRYMQKHMVKAGITGWAQIHGWRGDTDLRKRIEYDMYYIENWSLRLDLKIIVLTVFKGFVNKNAY